MGLMTTLPGTVSLLTTGPLFGVFLFGIGLGRNPYCLLSADPGGKTRQAVGVRFVFEIAEGKIADFLFRIEPLQKSQRPLRIEQDVQPRQAGLSGNRTEMTGVSSVIISIIFSAIASPL